MGTNGTGNPILIILFLCIATTVALAAIGFVLRGRGMLRARGPALAWAVLTILPLFGAGFAMFSTHVVEKVTGETKAGENADDVRSAP